MRQDVCVRSRLSAAEKKITSGILTWPELGALGSSSKSYQLLGGGA